MSTDTFPIIVGRFSNNIQQLSVDDIEQELLNDNTMLNEKVPSDQTPIKFFIDIDYQYVKGSSLDETESFRQFLNFWNEYYIEFYGHLNQLCLYLSKEINTEISLKDVGVAMYHPRTAWIMGKISTHIVIPKVITNAYNIRNILNKSMLEFNSVDGQKSPYWADRNVYKNGFQFRLPLCGKFDRDGEYQDKRLGIANSCMSLGDFILQNIQEKDSPVQWLPFDYVEKEYAHHSIQRDDESSILSALESLGVPNPQFTGNDNEISYTHGEHICLCHRRKHDSLNYCVNKRDDGSLWLNCYASGKQSSVCLSYRNTEECLIDEPMETNSQIESKKRGKGKKTIKREETVCDIAGISVDSFRDKYGVNESIILYLFQHVRVISGANGAVEFEPVKDAIVLSKAIYYFAKELRIQPLTVDGKIVYQFNTRTKLWEDMSNKTTLMYNIARHVSKFIPTVKQHIKDYFYEHNGIMNDVQSKTLDSIADVVIKQFTSLKGMNSTIGNGMNDAFGRLFSEDRLFFNKLNSSPYLYPFKSHNVDLRTGEIVERTADDYFSTCEYYDYDPASNTTDFKTLMMDKVFCGDADKIKSVQTFIGYAISGSTSEQVGLFLTGAGGNGKSELFKFIKEAFSSMHRGLPNTFMEKGADNNKELQLQSITKPRVCLLNEIKKKSLDMEFFKLFIDGGQINTKVLYEVNKEFDSRAKLIVLANVLPKFENNGQGISLQRRGLKENCLATFTDNMELLNEANHIYLKDKVFSERRYTVEMKQQVAKYFIEGSIEYFKNGIHQKSTMQRRWNEEVCQLNDSKNILANWMLENTYKREGEKLQKDELYQLVKAEIPMSEKDFLSLMKELGYDYNKGLRVNGKRGCFTGIMLKGSEEEPQQVNCEIGDELDN